MLTPNQLADLPGDLYALTAELNDRIIEDVARRMAKAGRLTGTAEYELFRLQQVAAFDADVQKYIAEYTKQSVDEINAMFEKASELSVANNIRVNGIKAVPLKDNKYLQQLVAQVAGTTENSFSNLTKTLAFLNRQTGVPMGFRETLTNALDSMELSLSTGFESYDTVIRRTVNSLAQAGLIGRQNFYITEKGRKIYRNLDVVVRQTAFGGLRLMTREQAKYNAQLLGTDVFQITWHAGHRPSHGWGGMRYSLAGNYGLPTREQLFAANGGGSLDDYGCRHDETAVDPEAPDMYSPEELAALEKKELETDTFNSAELDAYVNDGGLVRFRNRAYIERTQNGTVLNRYDQEERKREYERAIRSVRRSQTVAKDIWDNAAPGNMDDMALDYYRLKNRNNLITKEYEAFCKKMGLTAEMNRVYYDGRGRLGGAVPKKFLEMIN